MLTRINEFTAAEGKSDETATFLQSLVPYISSCEGCLGCEVLRSRESEDKFVVIEKWQSEQAHKASIAGFPQENMQVAMALFAGPPKGEYFTNTD